MEEYDGKIELLSEFYKFHSDIPRLFMLPIAEAIHNYYDKKRRLNFIRVTRMLNRDNPNPSDEPMPNLESDSESSNPGEDDDNNSAASFQDSVLPASLINSLYLKSSAFTRPAKASKVDTSKSFSQLLGVLTGIFKDPLADVSTFSIGYQQANIKQSIDAIDDAIFSPSTAKIDGFRDSIVLNKKKTPGLLDINQLRASRNKEQGDAGHKGEDFNLGVGRSKFEVSAKTNFLKKKNAEKVQGANIVRKALDRREGKSKKPRASKDKKQQLNLEESLNQLRKSYQNLNIHININFNERKKEQNSLKKCLDKETIEDSKKDYPKLNLFSLISKAKKTSIPDAATATHDTKAFPSEEKTFSSLEFVKVFKKKASEPETSLKGVKQTFLKKNSRPGLSPENPQQGAAHLETLHQPGHKDSLFGNKKHSVSSSINSIQQAVLSLGKTRVSKYKSAERLDSATKKPIDIFEKKRKVSLVSNHPSTKSRNDLRSSMKSQKVGSHRNNHSTNKIEPKSSRQSKGVARSAKKGGRKLFMSQDFNQSPHLLAHNPFENKGQGFTMPLPFKQSLKGNLLNQANLLTGSHSKNSTLFTHKFNSAKESSLDPFGNLTYRSKKSGAKFTGAHAGSDLDLVGKRKRIERGHQFKLSEANLNRHVEPMMNLSKNKRSTDLTGVKHSRVKSDLKFYGKAH